MHWRRHVGREGCGGDGRSAAVAATAAAAAARNIRFALPTGARLASPRPRGLVRVLTVGTRLSAVRQPTTARPAPCQSVSTALINDRRQLAWPHTTTLVASAWTSTSSNYDDANPSNRALSVSLSVYVFRYTDRNKPSSFRRRRIAASPRAR